MDSPVRKNGEDKLGRGAKVRLNAGGYVMIFDPTPGRPTHYVLEHRKIMSELLGRPLTADETVHHKNGNRTDNRLVRGHETHCPSTCCNLELWSKRQPYGQRIPDKVAYARQILALYAPDELPTGVRVA